ncbi:MAG: phage Gp37/Gp68 family protein [Deltaproteobacteria bacterium]|nr:phage Gp37/Gp68 family protein [Deltaproteobacteria bacterium]
MADTKIQWADMVWNPITGCTPTESPGCANCYAARFAKRFRGRFGYPLDDPFTPGTFHPGKLDEPLRWKKPRLIFVVSMGDLFHDEVSIQEIVKILWVIQEANRHTYLFLTKRPERMHRVFYELSITSRFNFKNLWLGISVSNQDDLDRWGPVLMQMRPWAAKLIMSYEPALGPVDFFPYLPRKWSYRVGRRIHREKDEGIDWIIVGGESGPGARPSHPDWFRSVRDQCQAAGVPFFFKQWGAWEITSHKTGKKYTWIDKNGKTFNTTAPLNQDCWAMAKVGKKAAGRMLDGRAWDEVPR